MVNDVRSGDVVLYAVRIREQGSQVSYYGCEVVDRVEDGIPLNASGSPFTSVKAVYYRNGKPSEAPQKGRILLARVKDDPGERQRLQAELSSRYGPGELITGIQCPGKSACVLR